MKKSKLVLSLLTLTMTGGLLSSCTTNEDVLKYIGIQAFDPVYIASSLGYFEDEGLKVEVVPQNAGGSEAIRLVNTNDINAGLTSMWALASGVDNGMKVKGITDFQSCFEDVPLEKMFVRKDSGIKTIEDLRGKKVCFNMVGSSFYYTWDIMLKKHGMTLDDVEVILLPFASQEKALMDKQVDVISVLTPYSSKAEQNSELELLYTDYDAFGKDTQFCQIIMNTDYMKNKPENAQKFVKAISRACNYVNNADDTEKAIYKQIIEDWTGIEKSLVGDYKYWTDGKCDVEGTQWFIDYMDMPHLKPTDLCTNELFE